MLISLSGEIQLKHSRYKFPASWLLGDHLGSTSMVTDASGVMVSEVRYSAFGETRYQNGTLTTDYLYTGQRQEAEIGLYYYVARWYDPAIGRFIQADSVVPNPASALGFDRYAYTNNNPLKYTDPSGHWEEPPQPCLDGNCSKPLSTGTLLWVNFKINIVDEKVWSGSDLSGAIGGVEMIANQFGRVTGRDGRTVFQESFGRLEFSLDHEMKLFGQADVGYNRYQPGRVTPRLVAHELGHSFERFMHAEDGYVYAGTDNPVQLIGQNGIYDVTGTLVTGLGQRYGEYGGYPLNGYSCDSYVGECQYHSKDVEGWDNSSEDWADMFMNWVFNSFSSTDAGDALINWVESNMANWLQN